MNSNILDILIDQAISENYDNIENMRQKLIEEISRKIIEIDFDISIFDPFIDKTTWEDIKQNPQKLRRHHISDICILSGIVANDLFKNTGLNISSFVTAEKQQQITNYLKTNKDGSIKYNSCPDFSEKAEACIVIQLCLLDRLDSEEYKKEWQNRKSESVKRLFEKKPELKAKLDKIIKNIRLISNPSIQQEKDSKD